MFETTSSVGGLWRYDPARSRPDSVMYKSLRTNLPKEVMLLRSSSVPPSAWSFMTHRSVLQHLGQYASAHDMQRSEQEGGVVRFNTQVTRVEPIMPTHTSMPTLPFLGPLESQSSRLQAEASMLPPLHTHNTGKVIDDALQHLPDVHAQWCSWRVHWASADPGVAGTAGESAAEAAAPGSPASCKAGSQAFDFVAVANGHYAHPSMPHLHNAGAFKGRMEHSAAYRSPEGYRGQQVLVVGSGPSGQDIGRELASQARTVFMSTHSCLPDAEAASVQAMSKGFGGDTSIHGGCPVLPVGAPVAVAPGGTGVITQHGTVIPCDVVLWCTGYFFSFPFLDCWRPDVEAEQAGPSGVPAATDSMPPGQTAAAQHGSSASPGPLITAAVRRVHPLYKQLFHAVLPSLAFVGLPLQTNPNPTHQHQADALAAAWGSAGHSGGAALPDAPARVQDMYGWYDQQTVVGGRALRHCAKMGAAQWRYLRELADSVGMDGSSAAATEVPLAKLLLDPPAASQGAHGPAPSCLDSCTGHLTLEEAESPQPLAVFAVLNSVLVQAGVVQCPQLALLPPPLQQALHKSSNHETGAALLNDAMGDNMHTEFPLAASVSSPAESMHRSGTEGVPGATLNKILQHAYDTVQFKYTPMQKLVLDNAMYVHCGGSRGGAPQAYRLQEYRYGDLLYQLQEHSSVGLQALQSCTGNDALHQQLQAHGVTAVHGAACGSAGSADFLWIIKQMRGWYVAAPMGSQCDPLAGKLAVDSLA